MITERETHSWKNFKEIDIINEGHSEVQFLSTSLNNYHILWLAPTLSAACGSAEVKNVLSLYEFIHEIVKYTREIGKKHSTPIL